MGVGGSFSEMRSTRGRTSEGVRSSVLPGLLETPVEFPRGDV